MGIPVVGAAALTSSIPSRKLCQKVMGAGGLGVVAAEVPRRLQRWDFHGAGMGMCRLQDVLGHVQAVEWSLNVGNRPQDF